MSPRGWALLGLTRDAFAGPDLVFPLRRHDFGVGAGYVDAGVQAGFVVCLDDVSAEDPTGADAAVVRALGGGESILGPAIRPAELVKQRVLLLQAEPCHVFGVLLHQPVGVVAKVVGVGLAVGHPRLAQDEDVVALTEGIGIHGDGAEIDVRVVAGGLAGRGAIKVPLGQL